MNKFISKFLSIFGYKLIKGQEYDKLVYMGKHKPQARSENLITAMDMKKSLVANQAQPVIIDVGAYTGQTVNEYLSTFPAATIFAFEPTPVSFSQLIEIFGDNNQVKCLNLAISNVNDEITFNINDFSPTNSVLSTDKAADTYWGNELLNTVETVAVQSRTLDEICRTENIRHIDILKLDVQGAELQVLHGAEQLLNDKRISIIYLEVIFVPTYNEQSTYFEIGELLSSKGYNLYGMFNLTYDKRLKQADMLFYSDNRG